MDIKEFENKAVQEYKDYETGAVYMLEFCEGTDYGETEEDTRDFFAIKILDENGETEDEECFLGTTPDNGDNIKMMAWEYNAVPVREVF